MLIGSGTPSLRKCGETGPRQRPCRSLDDVSLARATTPEAARVARRIDAYDVVDRPPREELTALADLVSTLTGLPLVTINLLTEDEQHTIAAHNLPTGVRDRPDSLCDRVMDEPGWVLIRDTLLDERFRGHPHAEEVRFYASQKLISSEGDVVGTMCVMDRRPRDLEPKQIAAVRTLADRVVDILELSLRSRELARSLREVERIRDRLAESNERLDAVASQLAHDLKSPLGTISMSIGLVSEELQEAFPAASDAVEPLLERATRGSFRLGDLIDRVLATARLDGAVVQEPVDLDAVLRDVLTDLADDLADAVLTVPVLPAVLGDELQLRALFQNLLSNAAKYRSDERPLEVSIRAAHLVDRWCVEVVDNGRGVSPQIREKMFERNVQGDASAPGHGIGLATCRRIVEAHGGQIGLSATPGGGTTVWFELRPVVSAVA